MSDTYTYERKTRTHTLSFFPWLLLVANQMLDIPYCVLTHIKPNPPTARLESHGRRAAKRTVHSLSSHCPRAEMERCVNGVPTC